MVFSTLATITQSIAELAGRNPVSGRIGILTMALNAGPVVRAIMAILLVLSLICWGIIVAKTIHLRRLNRESNVFVNLFLKCKELGSLQKECERFRESHLSHIFRIGYAELNRVTELLSARGRENFAKHTDLLLENVDRAIQSGVIAKRKRLQRLLPFLATIGSTAPFIGLFGTVWGIMTSFQDIGVRGMANLAVVAPGISEALVATAMGLAAAIPAVVAYNYFSNKIQLIEDDMLRFTSDFLNILKTELVCPMPSVEPSSAQPCIARDGQYRCVSSEGGLVRSE